MQKAERTVQLEKRVSLLAHVTHSSINEILFRNVVSRAPGYSFFSRKKIPIRVANYKMTKYYGRLHTRAVESRASWLNNEKEDVL